MTAAEKTILVAVTRRGVAQARLLLRRLGAGTLYRPDRYGPVEHAREFAFQGALARHVPRWFAEADLLVFFLAAGAVVRLIAPCLSSKKHDPGVLAIDEAGQFVIPLLSGHRGGANAFTRTVAGCLGAIPVVTTASDVMNGLSLDLWETEYGWSAEPAERLKEVALALVDQEPVVVIQEIGARGRWLHEQQLPDSVAVVRGVNDLGDRRASHVIWITDREPDNTGAIDSESILWFHPPSLVLGVGCERGLPAAALEDGLRQFLRQHCICERSIRALATLDLKADETGILELAKQKQWEIIFFSAPELARVEPIPHPSTVVEQCVGTPGVAEPAALLAAGTDRLLVEKQVVTSPLAPQRMTFAVARKSVYRSAVEEAGKVLFVGAGPGAPELLTLQAQQALRSADVVLYAGSLVPEQVLRTVPSTAQLHNSAHLTLEEIVPILVRAARQGKQVVRLHSGDPSIYGAIQEQMTLLDREEIPYEILPGISSFQAAAAVLQSELTVPEVVQTIILTRAEGQTKMPDREALESLARHGATLCIFLSARLGKTVEQQLLTAYPPDTPVAVAYRVSWPDEKIIVASLDQLSRTLRDHKLTRTTLILVGAAIGGRKNRSRLYDQTHGHIFRARHREEAHPSTERDA
jgi:precorrin-4 C11-methyltransferase